MVLAIFGCIFGILGIFTIGFVFVPLAAMCALFGLLSGIAKRQFSTGVLSILGGVLACVGWAMSPSLWLLTAFLMVPPAHKDEPRESIVNAAPVAAPPAVTASSSPVPLPPSTRDDPENASFNAGKRDRTIWERFTTQIAGVERDGALWWAGQRSLKVPGSCSSSLSEAYRQGCEEARAMLGPFDVQRKANQNYRAGWNSLQNLATTTNEHR
jgi:hypothetical protein